MIGDMELAGLSSSTQQCYLRAVLALQRHTAARPDRLTEEQVYQYVLCLRDEKGVSKGTFQPHWHGIKFFYFRTLEVDWALFTRKKVCQPRRQRLPQAIAYLSRHLSLHVGDLILMGTPSGVGPLVDGDQVRCSVSGIGTLQTLIQRAPAPQPSP